MLTVRIMNEFLHGPVWMLDEEGISAASGVLPLVEDDDVIWELNREAGFLFDSYYEFDSNGQPYWFNEERERDDKERMLGILAKLVARLDKVNDGSFAVEDLETPRLEEL